MSDSLLYITEVAPYGPVRPAGVHRVLPQSVAALAMLADMAGLQFIHSDDVRTLTPDAIRRARVLALFTIGETRWSSPQREALLGQLRGGELSVLGIHSATDSCHRWPEFREVIGARFDGHPWTQELQIDVVDREHPATRGLPERWTLRDEIYLFRELREDAHVLLALDPTGLDMTRPGARTPPIGFPLAWTFTEGTGRVFYTALGHFPEAFENIDYLGHLSGALEWLLDGSGGQK
jgi:type 1 glutamine amidotransferase